MGRYVYSLDLLDVALVHRAFLETMRLANQAGRPNSARLLRLAHNQYQSDLALAASKGAIAATAAMKEVLAETAKRPDTGVKPHLRDNLVARPAAPVAGLQLGSVLIGDLDRLERVRNPDDGFAYWIVQEEGTTANVGREIFGYFFDRGFTNPKRPATGYTGTPDAQPLFSNLIPGPRGGRGGKGVIRRPIQPRFFVRDGGRRAANDWLADMQRIEAKALTEVVALSASGGSSRRPTPRGRRLR